MMLVEKSAFEVNPSASSAVTPLKTQPTSSQRGQRGGARGGRGRGRGRGAKKGADYAVLHGQRRGTRAGVSDEVSFKDEPLLSDDAPAEGLYVLIQTTICRRQVLRKVFQNDQTSE